MNQDAAEGASRRGTIRSGAVAVGLILSNAPAARAVEEPSHELAQTTRMMVQTIGVLRSAGHEEANYRSKSGSTLKSFKAGQSNYNLLATGADKGVVRVAVGGGQGPVALLVQIPATPPSPGSGLPAPTKPYFALATLSKTKLALWAFYSRIPEDNFLTREISDSLSGGKRPLAVFDPKFVAAAGSGPDRFTLK